MATATHTTPQVPRAVAAAPWPHGNRLLAYDLQQRRLWIAGQRLHRGVTGLALAGAGLLGIAARRSRPSRGVVWALTGTALVAHDWKDRAHWFRRGPQAD
jgi:hypothetical protein